MRWKKSGEVTTHEGHKLYFSGRTDKHAEGVGFLIHKDNVKSVMGYQPISSRLITIRLHAAPFNITVVQVYAPTSDYDDETVEEMYEDLQRIIDKTAKSDILILQGDWNAKIGEEAHRDWPGVCGRLGNTTTNERGLRLLEFASNNNLKVANTFGTHKPSRNWTWHSPSGTHHKLDYILVNERHSAGINRAKTRTFPGADIGSDHDLVMMNFRIHLKKKVGEKSKRTKFNLEKLSDPRVAKEFEVRLGGKFAPLQALDPENTSIDEQIDLFNNAITATAEEVLGKSRSTKRPWVTQEILDMCDRRRELKEGKLRSEEGARCYREANKAVKRKLKEEKEKWIEEKCKNIEESIQTNNTRRAYKIVKDLQQDVSVNKVVHCTTIEDKNGNCLTEEEEIMKRWTEYCTELYNHQTTGDNTILDVPPSTDTDHLPILKSEIEEAIKTLKKRKSPGVDNITSELVQAGGVSMVDQLHNICNRIWSTGTWPTPWTKSLIITIPKKGNLQKCNNYRTISLICHPSKVLLRIILNRLKPYAENIIAEEQAGFRAGRSTTEQIFNLRILSEKYQEHDLGLYHVFIDFKKAFDRVWHDALLATMNSYNINSNIIKIIQNLYEKASSAVLLNGNEGEWFRTTVGVRQGCILSPTLFNIYLERLMSEALEDHEGTVSTGGRMITNLRFADDIDGLAGSENELKELVRRLDTTSTRFKMEISTEKTKIMTNKSGGMTQEIDLRGEALEPVSQFKYLGSIITEEGSKTEISARSAQATAAISKLNTVWRDRNISLKVRIKLLRSLVHSIFLYACETWTLTSQLQKKIHSFELKCFRRILNITYRDRISNEEVERRIRQSIGPYEDLLTTVKKRKLKWYGHVTRSKGLAKTILQGKVNGSRRRGRPRRKWTDNIPEWTGLPLTETIRCAEDRTRWRSLVDNILMPQRS